MKPLSECSLTTTQLLLLQTCVDLETANYKRLAVAPCKSRWTVQTDFRRINELLGTRGSDEALLVALNRSWIKLSPPPPAPDDD